MRNLKKYFDALRLLSRVPSVAIESALRAVLSDVERFEQSAGANTTTASTADKDLITNLIRAVIDIAKADEAAAEKAGKADKP